MTKVKEDCLASGCHRLMETRAGFCLMHYKRWKRRGTTHDITTEERFFAQVRQSGDCWLWTGATHVGGYAQFGADGRFPLVHRWSYGFLRAEIPDGLHLDHLCKVRNCVNPWHLEPVTPRVNVLRSDGAPAINARKTQCIRGHAFDVANTYLTRDGRRLCRACARIRARK